MYDEDGLFGLKDYTLFDAVWYRILCDIMEFLLAFFLIISEKKKRSNKVTGIVTWHLRVCINQSYEISHQISILTDISMEILLLYFSIARPKI